jgi:hypothetical protein
LKPSKSVLEPHARQDRLIEFEEYHKDLQDVRLHPGVPPTVWQLFETAKNISLYARFAYRLHAVAEMMGFVALEWALKEFYAARNRIQPESVRKSFRD